MKPIIILPPDTMSADDIKMLRDNDLCVVVAADPAKVKFVDPIPAVTSRTTMEDAAIRLSRLILNPGFWSHENSRMEVTKTYCDILFKGTPLDPEPSQAEQDTRIFNSEKADELRRLAREEAKAERAAAKAAKVKALNQKAVA